MNREFFASSIFGCKNRPDPMKPRSISRKKKQHTLRRAIIFRKNGNSLYR